MNQEFRNWPEFSQEEVDAVGRVLGSGQVNYWTGNEGREFEREFAKSCNAAYAVALSNGTVALELALRALGIGPRDEVVVTPRTFIASVSAIVMVGATPIFADIDTVSQNITVNTVSSVLTERTRAIIAVHLAGWPCDMDGLMALANARGLFVIEDCAQSHGAMYKGKPVGGLGHVAAWSFCQDKIMTTGGEGGMVTTNDRALWSRMWSYKDHGKSWGAVYEREHPPGFRWLHDSLGTNLRMMEIQAAIGRIQLKRMSDWHGRRKANAEVILEVCRQFPIVLRVPMLSEIIEHAWYKCYVFVRPEGLMEGWGRDRIMGEINLLGVPCFSGTCSEVYLEKAFDNTVWRPKERLPVAKELGETSLMFLVHPTLTQDEISKTVEVIQQVMSLASK
ncbi:MAG: DegT/DnrJ/EryC1/StrS aminotransferase family protein [Ectothiorhodospiraceae bacterium]|nr:DegT/DnrJ/EryC1/StrS aminotransferase family protein [Ectothiorhodospiraceae bacterium]